MRPDPNRDGADQDVNTDAGSQDVDQTGDDVERPERPAR